MPERVPGSVVIWGVAAVVVVLAVMRLVDARGEPSAGPVKLERRAGAAGGARASGASGVYVHVAGAVRRPGLFRVAEGARVARAIERAGGPKPRAALTGVNLAARIQDGQQIVVPVAGPAGAGGLARRGRSRWHRRRGHRRRAETKPRSGHARAARRDRRDRPHACGADRRVPPGAGRVRLGRATGRGGGNRREAARDPPRGAAAVRWPRSRPIRRGDRFAAAADRGAPISGAPIRGRPGAGGLAGAGGRKAADPPCGSPSIPWNPSARPGTLRRPRDAGPAPVAGCGGVSGARPCPRAGGPRARARRRRPGRGRARRPSRAGPRRPGAGARGGRRVGGREAPRCDRRSRGAARGRPGPSAQSPARHSPAPLRLRRIGGDRDQPRTAGRHTAARCVCLAGSTCRRWESGPSWRCAGGCGR